LILKPRAGERLKDLRIIPAKDKLYPPTAADVKRALEKANPGRFLS